MKEEEYLTRLVGALTKFTKDQSDWSPGDVAPSINDDYSIVLSEEHPIETKAAVYEIQVHVLLGMTHQGQYTNARSICHQALDMYTETNCPLRRIRVIERLLYIAVIEGEGIGDLQDLGSSAITTLTTTKVYFTMYATDERLLAKMRD